jgi:hypothetical protein
MNKMPDDPFATTAFSDTVTDAPLRPGKEPRPELWVTLPPPTFKIAAQRHLCFSNRADAEAPGARVG